ncbi:GNAT family N-acetyltransferase [Nonomuraea sp. H19]|uniref:GNAT family N-acetyltransferase n=1 Tax=Nonomuraea sp. H19 TaxID=3452206 RepID=UPI003F8C53AD
MRAEIIDPTVEPVPADWELFRKREGLIAAWQADALTAVAWCSTRPVRLGVVRDGGQVIALFSGEVTRLPPSKGRYADLGRLPLTGWFNCRLLIGFTSGFAFATELSAKGRAAALDAFEKALRRRLGRHCLGILYRQITDDLLPMVGRRLRPRFATAPNTLLRNRWPDMDAYFGDLPRDRRRRLRKIHAEAAEGTRVLAGVSEIDPVQASALAQATLRKHGRFDPPLPARYFRALSGESEVRYFGHLDGDRLLAFDLTFDDGRRLVTTVTGALEVRDGGRRNLYFDLYLREIAYMIEHGREGCEFGKGMAELKQRFGCELIPQSAVIAAW